MGSSARSSYANGNHPGIPVSRAPQSGWSSLMSPDRNLPAMASLPSPPTPPYPVSSRYDSKCSSRPPGTDTWPTKSALRSWLSTELVRLMIGGRREQARMNLRLGDVRALHFPPIPRPCTAASLRSIHPSGARSPALMGLLPSVQHPIWHWKQLRQRGLVGQGTGSQVA